MSKCGSAAWVSLGIAEGAERVVVEVMVVVALREGSE